MHKKVFGLVSVTGLITKRSVTFGRPRIDCQINVIGVGHIYGYRDRLDSQSNTNFTAQSYIQHIYFILYLFRC
jgi:hypothetical protein